MSGPFRSLHVLLLVLLCFVGSDCLAQPVDLYSGNAPVVGQDEAERSRALGPALVSALVRASGDSTVAADARLAPLLAQAPAWLQTYGYRQDVETGPGGTPVVREYLQARFDPAGVQTALTALGRSVWSERPRSLLWLVIDDGSARRIASAAQVSALGALTRQARERGVSIELPRMDAEDAARIDADTLWTGPHAAALAAASRYGTPVVLIARLSRAGAGWQGRFSLADGARPENWSGTYADASAALAAAADGFADRLAQRFAVAAGERVVAEYTLTVAGVDAAEDYARVMAYLGGLSVVQTATPIGAEGSTLILGVTLNVSPSHLRRVLALGGVLDFEDGALAEDRQIALRLQR